MEPAKAGLDWNTIIVSAIISAPSTVLVLKMYRDLVNKVIKTGLEDIVNAIKNLNERAEDRHYESILKGTDIEKAVAVCRYGGKLAKKHAQNAPSSSPKKARKGIGHPKKRSRGKGNRPRQT